MATITFNGQILQRIMYFSLSIQDLQQIILLFNFGYNLRILYFTYWSIGSLPRWINHLTSYESFWLCLKSIQNQKLLILYYLDFAYQLVGPHVLIVKSLTQDNILQLRKFLVKSICRKMQRTQGKLTPASITSKPTVQISNKLNFMGLSSR